VKALSPDLDDLLPALEEKWAKYQEERAEREHKIKEEQKENGYLEVRRKYPSWTGKDWESMSLEERKVEGKMWQFEARMGEDFPQFVKERAEQDLRWFIDTYVSRSKEWEKEGLAEFVTPKRTVSEFVEFLNDGYDLQHNWSPMFEWPQGRQDLYCALTCQLEARRKG
jgi:hypothetical protein